MEDHFLAHRTAPEPSSSPPTNDERSESAGFDRFLAFCARLHKNQRGWTLPARMAWWLLLMPVASWCWAANFTPGWPRRIALGTVTAITVLAALPGAEEPATEVVAASKEDVTNGADTNGAASDSSSPPATDRSDITSSSTTASVQPFAVTDDRSATITSGSSAATADRATTAADQAAVTRRRSTTQPTTTVKAPTTGLPASTAMPTTTTQPTSATAATEPLATVVATTASSSGGCDPNYDGCVPIASDVDCAGGQGNGPAYVTGPVRVLGTDIYGLDRDGNGIGCEPRP